MNLATDKSVRINGWGILHPDGRLELDYYHTELSYNKYGGPKLTPEQWMERYRPDCTLHRVTIEIALNEASSPTPR